MTSKPSSPTYYSHSHCEARVVSKGFIQQCKFRKLISEDGDEQCVCKKHLKRYNTGTLKYGLVSENPTVEEEQALKKRLQIPEKPRPVGTPMDLYSQDFRKRYLSHLLDSEFISTYKPMLHDSWKQMCQSKQHKWIRTHIKATQKYEEKMKRWKQYEFLKTHVKPKQTHSLQEWTPPPDYQKIRLNLKGYKNVCALEHIPTGKIYQIGKKYLQTQSKDDLFSFAKRVSVNGEFGKDDKFITMPGEFTSDEEEEIED